MKKVETDVKKHFFFLKAIKSHVLALKDKFLPYPSFNISPLALDSVPINCTRNQK